MLPIYLKNIKLFLLPSSLLSEIVLKDLGLKTKKPNLNDWKKVVKAKLNPKKSVEVAMVGKYTELKDSYKSLNEALDHAGIKNNAKVATNNLPITAAGTKFFVFADLIVTAPTAKPSAVINPKISP